MASKMVFILVAVALVLNFLVVTGESTNAGNVTLNASGEVGQGRETKGCQQFGESCNKKDLICCEDYFCRFKHGKGFCDKECLPIGERCNYSEHLNCCYPLTCIYDIDGLGGSCVDRKL